MNIDPAELEALDRKLDALWACGNLGDAAATTEAVLDVIQGVRGLFRIIGYYKAEPVAAPLVAAIKKPALDPRALESRLSGYTGDACQCGEFKLRRKGTCVSCDACSFSTGCG